MWFRIGLYVIIVVVAIILIVISIIFIIVNNRHHPHHYDIDINSDNGQVDNDNIIHLLTVIK